MRPSSTQPKRTLVTLAALAAVGLMTSSALAQDDWATFGADCETQAFGDPGSASLQGLDRCTRLWFAYVPPGPALGDLGERVREGVERLYKEGSDAQAHLAKQVLGRLGATSLPKRRGTGVAAALGEQVEIEREKCVVPPPSKGDKKKANRAFKKGMSAYKKENYEAALGHFLVMVDIAPGWTKSHYNVAAMYAMTDNEEKMVEHLYCLRDIGNSDAIKALYKARKDDDFAGFRDKSAPFKIVTGYARIKIGNSIGEYGEDNVDNLEGMLEALGYEEPLLTETSRPYTEPHVWYKPEARVAAYMVVKLLNHKRTRTHIIDWDNEDYDLIIAWGDKITKGEEPRLYINDPADAEKSISDLRRQHEEAMRKPEEFARTVDNTLGTPQAIADDVSSSVDRTIETGKKLTDTVDKVINIAP